MSQHNAATTSRIVRALVEMSDLPMTEDEVSALETWYLEHREALGRLRSVGDPDYVAHGDPTLRSDWPGSSRAASLIRGFSSNRS